MDFIEIKNAQIGYTEPLAFEVNLSLKPGDICLLVGNNGMGKSTLMKTILGQVEIQKGTIFIKGKNIKKYSLQEIAKEISVVFSKSQPPAHYTVWDLVSLGKYIHYPYYFKLDMEDEKEIEKVIEKLDLEKYKNYKLSELSDGNLQKVFIGRALVQNTPMIILDEPTAHLDEENKVMILSLLKDIAQKENKVILFSSHDWRLAKDFVNKIWWLKDKKIRVGQVENAYLPTYPTIDDVLYFLK